MNNVNFLDVGINDAKTLREHIKNESFSYVKSLISNLHNKKISLKNKCKELENLFKKYNLKASINFDLSSNDYDYVSYTDYVDGFNYILVNIYTDLALKSVSRTGGNMKNRGVEDAKKLVNCIISNILINDLNDLDIVITELTNSNTSTEFKYKLLEYLFKKYNLDIHDIELEEFNSYLNDFLRINNIILIYLKNLTFLIENIETEIEVNEMED